MPQDFMPAASGGYEPSLLEEIRALRTSTSSPKLPRGVGFFRLRRTLPRPTLILKTNMAWPSAHRAAFLSISR